MDKEEILKRAQNEADEMEVAIQIKSLGISTIIIPCLAILFIIIRILHSEYIISDLVTITLAQLSISQIYYSIKLKKKIFLLTGIITLILTALFMLLFIHEVLI